MSVTFDAAQSPVKINTVDDAGPIIGRLLPALQSNLAACGLTVMGTLDDSEIAGLHRSSYDPASRADVDTAQAKVRHGGPRLRWKDAIPQATEEGWAQYAHDSGLSVSYALAMPPTQLVTSGVLARLMSPRPYDKRVTLVYKTLPPEHATAAVEKETTAAQARRAWNNKTKRDPTEREQADEKRAKRAAEKRHAEPASLSWGSTSRRPCKTPTSSAPRPPTSPTRQDQPS